MKNNIQYCLLTLFVLFGILSRAQQRDNSEALWGDWKVSQIETLYQNEDGSPYRDAHITEDRKMKNADVELCFTSDSVQFVLHNGNDRRTEACRYGEGYYEVNSKEKGFLKYTYEIKGRRLWIERKEKNMQVYGEAEVPKVIYRFILKRK